MDYSYVRINLFNVCVISFALYVKNHHGQINNHVCVNIKLRKLNFVIGCWCVLKLKIAAGKDAVKLFNFFFSWV